MQSSILELINIMKQLRDPLRGCEWDRVQTLDSIKSCTLEETYEVLDAIDKKDYDELKTELGDLLYQIVFYAELASEQQKFDFDDIVQAICAKLVHRHPHVFNAEHQTGKPNWELLKLQERSKKQQFSILDDVSLAQPALMRAEKIQKRCASVGFDWQDLTPVFDKVKEELEEVRQELAQQPMQLHKVEEEVGDLFFAVVNLARHLGLKSELTLQKATQKFERRFKQVEQHFKQLELELTDISLEQMEHVWQQVKLQETRHT